CSHGGTELVADVGDEVTAHSVETPPLGDVVDHGDGADDSPPTVLNRLTDQVEHAAWRPVQLESSARSATTGGNRVQQLVDSAGGERVGVPWRGQVLRMTIPEHDASVAVMNDDGLCEGVQRSSQQVGLGPGHLVLAVGRRREKLAFDPTRPARSQPNLPVR